jgi:hypothetical protein
MKEIIQIEKYNEVYNRIKADPGIIMEMSDYFTFSVPGAKFTPAYKNKYWDGKIRLLNSMTGLLYGGLLNYVEEFCNSRNYDIEYISDFSTQEFSLKEANDFVINIKPAMQPRDYQLDAFVHAVRERRALLLSPTACHMAGDKVLMYSGEWKNIEDIKIGEYVIGEDGLPKKVINTFNGEDDLYHIQPKNNSSKITVTGNHLLPLKFSDYSKKYGYGKGDKNFIENLSVVEYINKSKYYKHSANIFYNNKIINFENQKDPETLLSPYFIGCYLGDGHCGSCAITNIDKEIIDEIYKQAEISSCNVVINQNITYFLRGKIGKK